MVNKERAPENVNPRSKELRLVAEKKINQTEGNANEEMEDALQRGAQELSIVTRKFVSKRMNYKEEVEIVQDRTQEVGHAAAKDVNKKRSEFDQVDSEGAALDGANDSASNRDQTGQLVKAQNIPFSVLSKICKELNNKDELSGRDFRLLGKKMGFDKSLTKDLELKVNPTYELLEMWRPNPESTVENLLMILKDDEMEKWDVATILENWLKKKISQELRLVAEKKINQTEGKANVEMEDALQRGAQELSILTRKFESKKTDDKEEVEIVHDGTQEVGHAAAKDVNKKRSGFDQVDSEGKVLFSFSVIMLVFYLCKKKEKNTRGGCDNIVQYG